MSPEILLAAFRVATFVTVTSLFLVVWTPSASEARAISILSLVVGLLFMGVIALVARKSRS